MAFTVSEIMDPVIHAATRKGRARSQFTSRLDELPIGKAFIVSGMRQTSAASRAHAYGRQCQPSRKFKSTKVDENRVQIMRVA